MQRRTLIAAAALAPLPSFGNDDVAAVLARGGVALVLRHALTEPGTGDPPGYRLADCATQRNLSAEGRAQARRLGEWFAQRRLTPAVVRSSRWCRCIDTAQIAFGRAQPDDALNSFFDNPEAGPAQTATSRTLLARIPPATFEVWVTHQVNASALTGEWLAMGEALVVVSADGGGSVRVVARLLVP